MDNLDQEAKREDKLSEVSEWQYDGERSKDQVLLSEFDPSSGNHTSVQRCVSFESEDT